MFAYLLLRLCVQQFLFYYVSSRKCWRKRRRKCVCSFVPANEKSFFVLLIFVFGGVGSFYFILFYFIFWRNLFDFTLFLFGNESRWKQQLWACIWYTSFIYTATITKMVAEPLTHTHTHMDCGPWNHISSETDKREKEKGKFFKK
jgi:hypothetical protein